MRNYGDIIQPSTPPLPLREGVDAGVVLCCHLLAGAQAAGAHDLAAASTESAGLLGVGVQAAAYAVAAS
jgi:hypothetical protein